MGGQAGGACRQGAKGGSTFLKGRHLAGLKVCSVSSSPSIVSVQSDRGASCNSKLSQRSRPGLKDQPSVQDGAAQSMQRVNDVARKVAEVAPPRASPVPRPTHPDLSQEAVTVTYPAGMCPVSETTTDQ